MEIDTERSRKRSEAADNLPADKRPCSSSSEFVSSSSTQHELPLPSPSQQQAAPAPPPSSSSSQPDCDLDEQSDQGGDSPYNSCDSDKDPDVVYVARSDPAPSSSGSYRVSRTAPAMTLSLLEDSLHCFPMDTSLPLLVRLVEHQTDPEIMLLSVRAITYLCDVMPGSADAVVRHGAVPVLCQRLLVIEYLDVAEQCLQALEKISQRQPVPCLQAGAITAALSYLDFFSTSIQRVALSTVANMCKKLPLHCSSVVMESVPKLCNLLQYEDGKVFPLGSLKVFSEDELERLLCGEQGTWNFSELLDHIKFDHGYTASSPPVVSLLEIIQEFGCDQRRAFLQFVTGAPRLPPGGLASLSPKLTIVRKHCGADGDMDLPSVMTCANYLKLPPYSSKETMKQRLLFAITEGQGSFQLS